MEIGGVPLEIQPKLLRLLQDREFKRVGDTKTHKANLRIVAATIGHDLFEYEAATLADIIGARTEVGDKLAWLDFPSFGLGIVERKVTRLELE